MIKRIRMIASATIKSFIFFFSSSWTEEKMKLQGQPQPSLGIHILEIPRIGEIHVCLLSNRNKKFQFRCVVKETIWHPAVNPQSNQAVGRYPVELFRQLTDLEYACTNPFNIDASIEFKRNPEAFFAKNARMRNTFETEECCICLDKLNDPARIAISICKAGHLIHDDCYTESIQTCPLCGRHSYYHI